MARKPSEFTEQHAATRYTARWHRVERWASGIVWGDLTNRDPRSNSRMSIRHGSLVLEEWNDEEAAERAVDLGAMELDERAAPRADSGWAPGGRRRVAIRLFTWVVEQATKSVYNPQWITTGQGFSAFSAVAQHNRYVRAYADAVDHGVESRRLGVTAMEVVWWTAAEGAKYV